MCSLSDCLSYRALPCRCYLQPVEHRLEIHNKELILPRSVCTRKRGKKTQKQPTQHPKIPKQKPNKATPLKPPSLSEDHFWSALQHILQWIKFQEDSTSWASLWPTVAWIHLSAYCVFSTQGCSLPISQGESKVHSREKRTAQTPPCSLQHVVPKLGDGNVNSPL